MKRRNLNPQFDSYWNNIIQLYAEFIENSGIGCVSDNPYQNPYFNNRIRLERNSTREDFIFWLVFSKLGISPICFLVELELMKSYYYKILGKYNLAQIEDYIAFSRYRHPRKGFSTIWSKKNFQTKKIIPLFDFPKKPVPVRRIGVGYRDKGNLRKNHELIADINDNAGQRKLDEERKILQDLDELTFGFFS